MRSIISFLRSLISVHGYIHEIFYFLVLIIEYDFTIKQDIHAGTGPTRP